WTGAFFPYYVSPMPEKEARIVTVCYQGRDPKSHRGESRRLAALHDVARTIAGRPDWRNLDAVVFPGGFLFTETEKARTLLDGRSDGKDMLAHAANDFTKILRRHSPAVQLVLGVDTAPYKTHGRRVGGQQLA